MVLQPTKSLFGDDEQPLLLLMDGHALVHRAFHAITTSLTIRKTGEEVRGVYGFANTFLKVLEDRRPTHCAIAFDLPTPTIRHKAFAAYKAQRPSMPDDLRGQFPWIKQLLEAFQVPIFEMDGYEADDVLGTLCRLAEEKQVQTLILTGDTDTLQLVSPWVRILMFMSGQNQVIFDELKVAERYGGLTPFQQPDVKALQGDSSDNIPGVPGIGAKTAIKLIQQFGSIEGLYDHLPEVEPVRIRQTLEENKDAAVQGKWLTTIVRDLPLELDMEASAFWKYDRQDVLALLRELEFNSIVPRVPEGKRLANGAPTPPIPVAEVDYFTIDTADKLEKMVTSLRQAGAFAFEAETTGPQAMNTDLVGLSFAPKEGQAFYLPLAHQEGQQLPKREALETIGPLLHDPALKKTSHNAQFSMTVLGEVGVEMEGLEQDVMIAAHVLGEKAVSLKGLAFGRLNEELTPLTDLTGTGRQQVTLAQVPIEKTAEYACANVDMATRLQDLFNVELKKEGLTHILDDLETPLVPVLVRMQRHGIALNTDLLATMSESLGTQLARLEQESYDAVGHMFNISSPQQLAVLLYDELKLAKGKRTASGGYSTDAAALENLRGAHPVVDSVLEYRRLSKLKSTYVDALPLLVNPRTGRVHTTYNQAGSATGRVASSDPNLQNIPVRDEDGRLVRNAFVAEGAPEWTLLAADYSQIELRVMAHLSMDPGLLEAFRRDEDIHSATAALVHNVPLDQVTSGMRRLAKVMNFGIIYGLSAFGIAQQTELSPDEGTVFIKNYFEKYAGIKQYINETKERVRDQGYVETLLGRRRHIPEVSSSNFQVRQAGERMAVNMPVQGTAADIIKIAMVRLDETMRRLKLRSRMLLQVHDELIFEVPQEELEEMQGLVLDIMPKAMELAVPLKVDLKKGDTWGEME
jgi:DNA polymerase-1